MDKLFLRNFKVMASVGLLEFEKQAKQPLLINLEFQIEAAKVTTLEDSVDYAKVREVILAFINLQHYELLEVLADSLASLLIQRFKLQGLKLRIEKTEIFSDVEGVGISVER